MKNKHLILLFFSLLYSTILFSQSHFEDMKNLEMFRKLYESRQSTIDNQKAQLLASQSSENKKLDSLDIKNDIGRSAFAESILKRINSSGIKGKVASNSSQNSGGLTNPSFSTFQTNNDGDAQTNNATINQRNDNYTKFQDKIQKDEILKELDWCVTYIQKGDSLFKEEGINEIFKDFPKSFKYLSEINGELARIPSLREPTGVGISSFLGISETEIITAIAEWSLSRAQEELMRAFLRDWFNNLNSDTLLKTAFPNTLNMLSTSDLSTIITDGATWKETFKQDLDNIPVKIPELTNIALLPYEGSISESQKNEIISGIELISNLFKELGTGQNPDEIILMLGNKSYLRTKTTEGYITVIDKSVIGMNVFLSSLRYTKENKPAFVSANEILSLSDMEIQTYWNLIYLREYEKLKIVFDLDTVNEKEFYTNIKTSLYKFQLKMADIANSFENIVEIINSAPSSNLNSTKQFDPALYHEYVLSVFDLAENGLDILTELTIDDLKREELNNYKNQYMELYEYISYIQEGVRTKKYGLVVLNTVNIFLWINNNFIKNEKVSESMLLALFSDKGGADALNGDINPNIILDISNPFVGDELKKYCNEFPNTCELLNRKFLSLKNELLSDKPIKIDKVNFYLNQQFSLSNTEKDLIINDINNNILSIEAGISKFDSININILDSIFNTKLTFIQTNFPNTYALYQNKYNTIIKEISGNYIEKEKIINLLKTRLVIYDNDKETIIKDFTVLTNEQFNKLTNNVIHKIVDIKFQEKLSAISGQFPNTEKIFKKKYATFENAILNEDILSIDTIKYQFKQNLTLNKLEKRKIGIDAGNYLSSTNNFNKYGKLMANIILAENKDDIKSALEGSAMKTGGYLIKQKSAFSASVTFYPGFECGYETLAKQGKEFPIDTVESKSSLNGKYLGPSLPIGIEFAFGTNRRPIGSIGLFIQVLDLGAVLSYSLSNESDSTSVTPEFGFKQVISPGSYLTLHFSNNPITLGLGCSYSPDLREINNGITTLKANSFQYGIFLAVDLNVFPIYSSKKKYTLKHKSISKQYDKNK